MQLLVVIQPLRPALDQPAVPKKKVSKKCSLVKMEVPYSLSRNSAQNIQLRFRYIMKGGS